MIVITGGAGFIGSCLVSQFNALGQTDLIIVDHLEANDPKQKNLSGKKFLDYLDKEEFLARITRERWDKKTAGIIHMGACSSTTLEDAAYFEKNNFKYTRQLVQWAVRNGVRFIYASSAATYGDGTNGYSDEDAVTDKLKPLNLYGLSKHKFDLWVLEKRVTDKVVGLKFFNVFGPNEYHKGDMRSVVAKAYDRVTGEGKIALFKSYKPQYAHGEQKRDFIYIKDAIDVVLHFWNNPSIGGIFNVGTGLARSWNDLARALFASVGKDPHIEYIEMPEALRERYQYFTQADVAKLRRSGYQRAFMSLEEAVKDYAKYLKNKACL